MGFFSKLKKIANPGGAIMSSVAGDGHNYIGPADYFTNGRKNADENAKKQQEAQRAQYTQKPVFSPDPGLNPQAQRLGWTNGGRQYANSPFNANGGMGAPPPQGPPMSFGGGGGGLQSPPQGGMVPGAGAQTPMGPPTMQIPQNPQLVQAQMLRNGPQRMM